MATERSAQMFLDLWSAARRSVAAVSDALAERGIGDHELAVLLHLAGAGRALTVTELADEMGVAFMTASDAVTRLEREGDVRRESNPSDRRSNLIALTREGKRRAAAATKLVSRLADDVGAGSRDELERSAARLRDAFASLTKP
jgi:DNA-binding MarR family transcriptional regulator